MSVKIAYNNTPSLVLLCENMVKLDPAGLPHDHAELTEVQQGDAAVKNMSGRGTISLLSIDEAVKRESRRQKTAAPSAPPRTAVENPATPPPAPEAPKEEPALELEKAPETEKALEPEKALDTKPAENAETVLVPEAKEADAKDENADANRNKGKKNKKSRRG